MTIRLEDNTPTGHVVLDEPVEDADQAVADTSMSFALLGDLVVLRVRPYREDAERGYVVNTFTRTARRCDSILTSCLQLPEEHGIIHPAGFELRTGESKSFDLDAEGMVFEAVRRSPNGEDVMYVFHERAEGLSIILAYNLIRREVQPPISAHGWSLFDDGTLVVFREDAEPTRIHPMQLWTTPFVSDEFHARQPVGDSMLHRIGNAELVRGISEAMNIAKQAREAEPSAVVYSDLSTAAARLLDGYYWLPEDEVGDLAAPLSEIRATSGLIIDEFEKVQTMRSSATGVLDEARADIETLRRDLSENPPADAAGWVDALRNVRQQRGHVITLRDVRYIDMDTLDAFDAELAATFDDLSRRAGDYFAEPDSFQPFHVQLGEVEQAIASTTGTAELETHREAVAELGDGLEVLTQVVGALEIDDPTVRTEILERLSEVMAGLNRARALGDNKRKQLATSEGAAAFSVEMTLFAQSSTGELARLKTPEDCDEALGRLLLQLEDLETRFAEFDEELAQIGDKRDVSVEDLSHAYSAVELNEMRATFERLLRVQQVLLAVNQTYISSAAQADEYRTEPPFQLQGSYRNMARLAEKILPIMSDDEIEALLDDHYRGEAQTLTSGAESNLLKLRELRGTLGADELARWNSIKETFQRAQRTGEVGDDPMLSVAGSLVEIGEALKDGLTLKWDMDQE
jgi:hypothetical protein